jgi:hypothetical protein
VRADSLATDDSRPAVAAGLTVADVARRYRVSPDKMRAWIKRGELLAINISSTRCGRPRYVVTADALAAFEAARSAAPPPKPKQRRRKVALVYYFPVERDKTAPADQGSQPHRRCGLEVVPNPRNNPCTTPS